MYNTTVMWMVDLNGSGKQSIYQFFDDDKILIQLILSIFNTEYNQVAGVV